MIRLGELLAVLLLVVRDPLLKREGLVVARLRMEAFICWAWAALLAETYCFTNFWLRLLSRLWIVFEPIWMKFY
jgi:hypothetical protein